MILFASGRTDIPAFYSEWFVNRIKAGFLDVRNPYHKEQVTRYSLDPRVVDCLVFCTKNPKPILAHLDEFEDFGKYFFVTITPYGKEIEPNVPEKDEVIKSFIELSKIVGTKKICWRYDPIFVDSTYSVATHIREFKNMCEKLAGYTNRVIISFIDLYAKTAKNFPELKEVSLADQKFLAGAFSSIASKFSMSIETCAEANDLSAFGVKAGACVSKNIIEAATGLRLAQTGTQRLRKHCSCIPMRDIASYNCCPHLCKYCYANYDENSVKKNYSKHNPASSFLIGEAQSGDIIHLAEQKSFRDFQQLLF
ncbi:DUF1848 domain-containing protein [Treponema pectinovorum]|uniref:DUF1848 domain-containing protein n=1 Tax=Treponema pectinovorum TaxID=164 RepID=UPI003D937B9A